MCFDPNSYSNILDLDEIHSFSKYNPDEKYEVTFPTDEDAFYIFELCGQKKNNFIMVKLRNINIPFFYYQNNLLRRPNYFEVECKTVCKEPKCDDGKYTKVVCIYDKIMKSDEFDKLYKESVKVVDSSKIYKTENIIELHLNASGIISKNKIYSNTMNNLL